MTGGPRDCGPILIADDDAALREFVSAVLCEAGFETREAADGLEALRAVRAERPSVLVLEVCLPGLSGYEVCRALRDDFGPSLPIVFISGERVESFDRVAGLLLGADDYLVKPFAPDELLARVRALLRRSRPLAPAVAARLTGREMEVLRLLADGLEQAEIARQLMISPKTVATHIEHILGKLGVHSRAQAVALAYREGLIELAQLR